MKHTIRENRFFGDELVFVEAWRAEFKRGTIKVTVEQGNGLMELAEDKWYYDFTVTGDVTFIIDIEVDVDEDVFCENEAEVAFVFWEPRKPDEECETYYVTVDTRGEVTERYSYWGCNDER